MSLLFPNAAGLSDEDHAKLTEAYEEACDSLVSEFGYTPEQLAVALQPMALATLTLFRAGQREKEALSRYAASKAAECLHYPRNG